MLSVRGVVFLLVLAVVMYFGGMILMTPALLVLPYSLTLYQKINDQCIALFFRLIPVRPYLHNFCIANQMSYLSLIFFLLYVVYKHTKHGQALLEIIFGLKVRICGDLKPLKGPCIILLNHRTRFDWLFLWCFMIRLGDLPRHKIILKSSLKKVPGLGWGMQAAQFLFLSRKWALDKEVMSETFSYFTSTRYPVQLLLFPEGTDLSESNKHKSHLFAEQNGLPKYEYLLNTRTRGFLHCVQELRKWPSTLSVVNMSVAYVGGMPQNERDIAAGNWPKEIHFYARHVPLAELPNDDQGLEGWLKRCWDDKEKQLEKFYSNKQFDAPYMGDEVLNRSRTTMMTALAIWCAMLAVVLYCVFHYPLAILCFYFLTTLFFAVVNSLTKGMDWVALKLHQMGKK